jgi:hypothetical protein
MRGKPAPLSLRAATVLVVVVSGFAISIGADTPSRNEVFLREAGSWNVTYKQWPQGTLVPIGEPTQHFTGIEINTVSADGARCRKKHACRELEAAEPTLGGPEFQRQAFKWATGDGLTLSYDPATATYSGLWGKEDERELGSMRGHFDKNTKTLLLTYVDPKRPQNSQLRHETRYIDERTKRVTISLRTPENAKGPLPTSWVIFEMVATKKAD